MREENRDFKNWLVWLRAHYATTIDEALALEAYHRWYRCSCEPCCQRQRMGVPPVRMRPGCEAPIYQIGDGTEGARFLREAFI